MIQPHQHICLQAVGLIVLHCCLWFVASSGSEQKFQSYLLFTLCWWYWSSFYVSLPLHCFVLLGVEFSFCVDPGFSTVLLPVFLAQLDPHFVTAVLLRPHFPVGVSVGLKAQWSPTMLCWVHMKKRASGSKPCTSAFCWINIYRCSSV